MIKKNIIDFNGFAIITFIENGLYEYSYEFPDFKSSFVLGQMNTENYILQYPGDSNALSNLVDRIICRTFNLRKYYND